MVDYLCTIDATVFRQTAKNNQNLFSSENRKVILRVTAPTNPPMTTNAGTARKRVTW